MLITISNLFPRPDQPARGLYNLYLFRELAELLPSDNPIRNICLVPEWRLWRWPAIRKWTASAGEQNPAPLTTEYLPVFTLPFIGRNWNWWFYSRALSSCLSRRPSPLSPLTFYVPWLYPDAAAVAPVIRGSGARLWLMALGSDTFHLQAPARRRKILEACADAEGIVCVSAQLAERLAIAGVSWKKLHVVPNGVDKARFRLRDPNDVIPQRSGLRSIPVVTATCPEPVEGVSAIAGTAGSVAVPPVAQRVVLFVGNLVPVKGPDTLLKAFFMLRGSQVPGVPPVGAKMPPTRRLLQLGKESLSPCSNRRAAGRGEDAADSAATTADGKSEAPVVTGVLPVESIPVPTCDDYSRDQAPAPLLLLLIGVGPMRASLEKLARRLGIADQVRFLGRQTPDEVAVWMNKADLLCLSSHGEGMPNVVLEARASGLPVVATPAGAVPELALGQDHFLVAKSDRSEDVAEALRDMLSRDLSARYSDPAVPAWRQQARTVLQLIQG